MFIHFGLDMHFGCEKKQLLVDKNPKRLKSYWERYLESMSLN